MDWLMDGWMVGCVGCHEGTLDVHTHSEDPPALSPTESVRSSHESGIVTRVVMLSEP